MPFRKLKGDWKYVNFSTSTVFNANPLHQLKTPVNGLARYFGY
jgi:hypothetical protein